MNIGVLLLGFLMPLALLAQSESSTILVQHSEEWVSLSVPGDESDEANRVIVIECVENVVADSLDSNWQWLPSLSQIHRLSASFDDFEKLTVQLDKRPNDVILFSNASRTLVEKTMINHASAMLMGYNGTQLNFDTTKFIVLAIQPTPTSDSLIDSLSRAGHWLDMMEAPIEPIGVDSSLQPEIDNGLQWLDSLMTFLNDTTRALDYTNEVVNELPEVLRQGKIISVELFVYQEGEFEFKIKDLSANTIVNKTSFLGKGAHSIRLQTKKLDWGVYHVEIEGPRLRKIHKVIIRG